MPVHIGVFAIIWDDQEQVLLCHRRDYDLWNLPGGHLEAGEAPWDGTIREVREETGLDVSVARVAGVYSKPEVNELVFSFVCTVMGGSIAITEEADRLEFFAPNALPHNMPPKQAERIQDALNYPHEVVMKVQRGRSSIELLKEGKL